MARLNPYGKYKVFYGLKHHKVKISRDVIDAGRRTRQDRATQPMDDHHHDIMNQTRFC